MQVSDINRYLKEYSETAVNINTYVAKKMGIILPGTYLKITEFRLACVPKTLTMKSAVLLAILSGAEVEQYKKFMNAFNSLNFILENPGKKEPIHFFIWGSIKQINPVENKENVYLIEFFYKSSPGSLIEIIGNYLDFRRNLENLAKEYTGKSIEITPNIMKMLAINSIEISNGAKKEKAEPVSLGVEQITVRVPQWENDIKNCTCYLHFPETVIMLPANIGQSEQDKTGLTLLKAQIQFNPEYVEILDNYFFNTKLKKPYSV